MLQRGSPRGFHPGGNSLARESRVAHGHVLTLVSGGGRTDFSVRREELSILVMGFSPGPFRGPALKRQPKKKSELSPGALKRPFPLLKAAESRGIPPNTSHIGTGTAQTSVIIPSCGRSGRMSPIETKPTSRRLSVISCRGSYARACLRSYAERIVVAVLGNPCWLSQSQVQDTFILRNAFTCRDQPKA